MLRVTFAFKMAPSNLKIKESIIEFYKLHSKKAMKVYEENWSGKDRPNMIQRIKQKQKEIDHDIVIRMFENL